ncbi:MAG: hypothetical protein IPN98_04190 [Propionivibrio sp.]|nr:hypothetical protein [Propionivibrio sp.]
MNQRLNELLIRRGRLLERIATQRAALGQEMPPLRAALYTTDRIVAGVRSGVVFIKQHPSIVTVAVAVLVVLKPGRIVRWAKTCFLHLANLADTA